MIEMATTKPPWNAHDISNHLALIFKVISWSGISLDSILASSTEKAMSAAGALSGSGCSKLNFKH